MTRLQIDIATVIMALFTIAGLFLVLMVTRPAQIVWQRGLFICMAFLLAGIVMVFVPEAKIYAALTGMTGVGIMIYCVLYVRWKDAQGKGLEPKEWRTNLIRAGLFLGVGLILIAPFATVVSNQEDIKSNQYSVFGLLRMVLVKLGEVSRKLDRDHDERLFRDHRDSLIRGQIMRSIEGVGVKVSRGLKNDSTVKATLKRTLGKPAKALNITIHSDTRPPSVNAPSYTLPQVKPLPAIEPVRPGKRRPKTKNTGMNTPTNPDSVLATGTGWPYPDTTTYFARTKLQP